MIVNILSFFIQLYFTR